MDLRLYTNFSKRKNSTKQPSGTGSLHTVRLKDGCSIENPIFLIDGVDLSVNYAKWNSDYYFVSDIVLQNNNIYEIRCEKDVLASHKTEIGSYAAFIERAASDYDVMINDNMIAPTQEIDYSASVAASTRPYPASTNGSFLIEVMNEDGIKVVACDSLEPFGVILNPASYTAQNIIDWIDSKISQAFDLDVYIGGVRWVPFDASAIPGATQLSFLKIGPINTQWTVAPFLYEMPQSGYYTQGHTLTLPTAHYNDFRQCNPRWTEYLAYMPGVGLVTLDSALIGRAILNNETISVVSNIDMITGDISYTWQHTGNLVKFGEYKGNVSVSVPIGKTSADIGRAFSTTVSGVAGAVTAAYAGNYAGAAVSAANAAASVADNILTPRTMITGGSGNKGLLKSFHNITISTFCYGTKEIPTTHYGRPLYEHKTISALSGFIKCMGASVPITGEAAEKDEVDRFLNSGFYYE